MKSRILSLINSIVVQSLSPVLVFPHEVFHSAFELVAYLAALLFKPPHFLKGKEIQVTR